MKDIKKLSRLFLFAFCLLTFLSCNFGKDLLEPTVTLTRQWSKKISGREYITINGGDNASIKFDAKANIGVQEYTEIRNSTESHIKRMYSLEATVNAYTAIYKVIETVTGSGAITETTYYIGFMVDNGPILYATDLALKAVDLVDISSIGLDELKDIGDLESITIEQLDNAKLKSMHMYGHRKDIEDLSHIKLTENNWLKVENRLFTAEVIIPVPQFSPDGSPVLIDKTTGNTPAVDALAENIIQKTNDYKTYVYLRIGTMGRMDVGYLFATNDNGVISANATASDALDFTKHPFAMPSVNYTNNDATTMTKNYLSTNHSMVYTTDNKQTTFITGIVTSVYNKNTIEQEKPDTYSYAYQRLEVIDDSTIKLIDSCFFVKLPTVATISGTSLPTPYYELPKDIVLYDAGTITITP